MIELSRHIESLMLKHDCVIVPGLGGFVTQYVPARYVAEEQLFLPPYRSVGFNSRLVLNDGLLVQSYMQAYDTNYPETLKLIEGAVGSLKETLRQEGEFELSGIGRLTVDVNGGYRFKPLEAGVLSPELYGLGSFEITETGVKANVRNYGVTTASSKPARKKISVKKNARHYTINISREVINYAAAVCVAVCCYFLWGTPIEENDKAYRQAASSIYENVFTRPASSVRSSSVIPVEEETVQVVNGEREEVAVEPQSRPLEVVKPTLDKEFTIVLASAISLHNAERYVESLQSSGLNDAAVYQRGKMVRVVYGGFSSEAEAAETIKSLRERSEFAEAWVLKKP